MWYSWDIWYSLPVHVVQLVRVVQMGHGTYGKAGTCGTAGTAGWYMRYRWHIMVATVSLSGSYSWVNSYVGTMILASPVLKCKVSVY